MSPLPVTLNPTGRSTRLLSTLTFSALAIIFLVMILQINHRITDGHSGDFRHFYFAAGALLDHRDLYGSVPDNVVDHALGRPMGKVEREWYTTDTDRYLYPPLIALLYTPIARLNFQTAQRVILIVNALLACVGIFLTAKLFADRLDLSRNIVLVSLACLIGSILNLDKIHVELQMFQTNSLLFFMFAASLFLLDRKPILAGIPLGVILNVKYLSLGLLPWLIMRRRWGTAISCALSTVILALLPAVISGWKTNLDNLATACGGLLHMIGAGGTTEQANVDDIRDYLSCSITSAMARTTSRGQSLILPMIGSACIALLSAVIVIWMYLRSSVPVFSWPDGKEQSESPWKPLIGVEFVSIVAATLCFSPQTNTRHLMLALLLTIPIASLIIGVPRGVSRVPAIIAGLLIGVGFIFPPGGQSPESHHLALWWFGIGGQCWCLLLAMFLLVYCGLELASSSRR